MYYCNIELNKCKTKFVPKILIVGFPNKGNWGKISVPTLIHKRAILKKTLYSCGD
jgi:predicted ATP-grasp superfamily ATP-dependent carboligase